jgi:hypothetical protein
MSSIKNNLEPNFLQTNLNINLNLYIIMRKLLSFLVLVLFLSSCASGPEKTAQNFTENLAKGKVDEAKKYATESTGKLLDFASGFGAMELEPNFKFVMEKDSIVQDKAWVTYKNPKGETETLQLVKIDGKWLVHMESKK